MGWFNQFFFSELWVHATVGVDLGGYIPPIFDNGGLPSAISSSVHATKNTALMEIQPWVDWVLSVAVANLTKSALFCISPFNFS